MYKDGKIPFQAATHWLATGLIQFAVGASGVAPD
jgi:hypothetical protein